MTLSCSGNASEYQVSEYTDAVSEAASVRSERSTNLDDGEDVDDNLSDMVSANVSGKGESQSAIVQPSPCHDIAVCPVCAGL